MCLTETDFDKYNSMSYAEVLEMRWQDALSTCEELGIIKPKYTLIERIIGYIKWRIKHALTN